MKLGTGRSRLSSGMCKPAFTLSIGRLIRVSEALQGSGSDHIRRNTLRYCALQPGTSAQLFIPLCRAEHRRDIRPGPRGARQEGAHSIVGTRNVPSTEPGKSRESQESSRQWGGLFFGYVLLAGQKKVTRGQATKLIRATCADQAAKKSTKLNGQHNQRDRRLRNNQGEIEWLGGAI